MRPLLAKQISLDSPFKFVFEEKLQATYPGPGFQAVLI